MITHRRRNLIFNAPGVGTPGVWVRLNNAAALLPGWGSVTPFVLRGASQFRPEPPPALDSERYAKDYNEIKEIGIVSNSSRSAEQSQIATFWRASPTAIWNPVLTQVVAARNLNLSDKARLFALFYLAAADSSIACWEAKYTYNFWRPQPAIRTGDLDGNDFTVAEGVGCRLLLHHLILSIHQDTRQTAAPWQRSSLRNLKTIPACQSLSRNPVLLAAGALSAKRLRK